MERLRYVYDLGVPSGPAQAQCSLALHSSKEFSLVYSCCWHLQDSYFKEPTESLSDFTALLTTTKGYVTQYSYTDHFIHVPLDTVLDTNTVTMDRLLHYTRACVGYSYLSGQVAWVLRENTVS